MKFLLKFRFYFLGLFLVALASVIVLIVSNRPSGLTGDLKNLTTNTVTNPPQGRNEANLQPKAAPSTTTVPSATFAPTLTRVPTSLPSPTPRPSSTPTSAPTATATVMVIPTQAAPQNSAQSTRTLPSVYSFSLLYLTQPAIAGVNAQATIQTVYGATCSISVYMPGENFPMVKALPNQTAGYDGICSWVWQVGTNTKRGTGFVKISSNGMNQTFNFIVQ